MSASSADEEPVAVGYAKVGLATIGAAIIAGIILKNYNSYGRGEEDLAGSVGGSKDDWRDRYSSAPGGHRLI